MTDDAFLERLEAVVGEPRGEARFHRLCRLYEEASPEQRDLVRVALRSSRHWHVPDDRTLADGAPRDLPPAARIRAALLYHVIEDGGHDLRDSLVGITLVYHGALAAGLDAGALFRSAAALASPAMAQVLRDFAARPATPGSMGYHAVPTEHGGVRWEV